MDHICENQKVIALIGGTGKEGNGLARRWAKSGHRIIIGSRDENRAQTLALDLANREGLHLDVQGATNSEAAKNARIVVLTVPYMAHKSTLESISTFLYGKILVDVTVPLSSSALTEAHMPEAGSASLEARNILGGNTKIVTAFQNVSFELLKGEGEVSCDVLVCGDDVDAKAEVIQLAQDAGMRGWDAGPLSNSVIVEGLTSILIGISKRHKVKGVGIRITNICA